MSSAGTWDQLLGVTQAKLAGTAPAERRKLPVAHLSPNPEQPRKFFDAQALADLVSSVSVHGVLQPVLVRPHPHEPARYQLVAGERRWLAAQAAGLVEIPVVVREMSDQEALELGLVENVLREDITPLEEARALRRLIDAFGYSYAKLGERLGKNKAYVDHRVRLLKMPIEVQDALERGFAEGEEGRVRRPFSPRHAGVVVQASEPRIRELLIEAVFAEGLSVAQTSERLRGLEAPAVALLEPVTPTPALVSVVPAAAGAVLAAEPATATAPEVPQPAEAASLVDLEVAIDTLSIFRLITRAQRGTGRVSANKLLAALQSDRKLLKTLLEAADEG